MRKVMLNSISFQASDEMLHLVLEALRMTIKASKLKLIHQDLTT